MNEYKWSRWAGVQLVANLNTDAVSWLIDCACTVAMGNERIARSVMPPAKPSHTEQDELRRLEPPNRMLSYAP